MRKLIIIFIVIIVSVTVILNPMYWIMVWQDFWAKEYTANLQQYGSYEVSTSGIKEYERTVRKYKSIDENAQFTYFLQLPLEDSIMDAALKDLRLELPDELISDMELHDNDNYIILSFGKPLKEVKYKFLGYFNDGVNAKAKITFDEEYQDNVVYAYFMEKNVFFWESSYYAMEGSKRVLLGENLFYTYN